jgi:hypothetical protein
MVDDSLANDEMKSAAAVVLGLAIAMMQAVPVATQPPRAATLRSISVSASRSGEVAVMIVAVGALPQPTVGVLADPPRIYLDFPNVAIGGVARQTTSGAAPVLRVRVGAHPSPPSTRVVIDLATPQPHRLEAHASSVSVILGRPASVVPAMQPGPSTPEPVSAAAAAPTATVVRRWPEIPPVPALSTSASERVSAPDPAKPPAAPPTAAPTPTYAPIGPPPPPGDLERYRKQAWGSLDRIRLQQPLLMSLDAGEPQNADRIQMAVAEFERLRQDLAAFKPPETLAVYHAMLAQSSTLGLMAFTLRLDAFRTGDTTTTRNASSAAAGAVLLIERACAVVKCPPIPGK